MARAAIKGLPGARRNRPRHETPTAADLVDRMFTREAPNRLWVTDITEHRTYEGKIYCAVVLDTFSRRVVGWSIDSSQTAALVTNALGMAVLQPAAARRGNHSFRPRSARRIQPVVATPRFRRCGVAGKKYAEPSGVRRQWAADRALRPSMRSPGRPEPSRSVQRQFWRLIARVSRPRRLLREWVCRHRWRPGGSGTLAACRRSVWMSPPDGICPSPSVRRSRCCAPRSRRA